MRQYTAHSGPPSWYEYDPDGGYGTISNGGKTIEVRGAGDFYVRKGFIAVTYPVNMPQQAISLSTIYSSIGGMPSQMSLSSGQLNITLGVPTTDAEFIGEYESGQSFRVTDHLVSVDGTMGSSLVSLELR